MDYNTSRSHLLMREHGRYVQSIVEHILTIEDREKRTDMAYGVIEVMIALNPALKSIDDYRQKLWDQLHMIANYQLDVDAPFPAPSREAMEAPPERIPYPQERIGRMHYGRNIPELVEKCVAMEDLEKQKDFALLIGSFMKHIYQTWHKDAVADDQIKNDLRTMSKGVLDLGPQDNLNALDVKPGQRSKTRGPVIVDRALETARRGGKNRNRNNRRGRRR